MMNDLYALCTAIAAMQGHTREHWEHHADTVLDLVDSLEFFEIIIHFEEVMHCTVDKNYYPIGKTIREIADEIHKHYTHN